MNLEMKKITDIQRMMIAEGEDGHVEVLIYGKIGASGYTEDGKYENNTDQERFADYLEWLAKSYEHINIRLNSAGGSPYHGDGIVATIRKHVDKIDVYNDGIAASTAADIFFAVPKAQRHMAVNAKLMLHRTSGICAGDWETMQNTADMLKTYDESCAASIAAGTDMTAEAVTSQFLNGKDNWLSANKCLELGFIPEIESYNAENIPADVENMSVEQIDRYFEQKFKSDAPKTGVLETIRRLISSDKKGDDAPENIIDSQKEINDMTPEALKEAMRTGALKIEDVERTVAEVKEAEPVTLAAINRIFDNKLKPIQAENEALKAEIARLGGTPAGDGVAHTEGADPDVIDTTTVDPAIEASNRELRKALSL
jgi:ATP-dependent protease ClpP protease subunit